MGRYNQSFVIASTIALTAIAQMSWLSAAALAQTPFSDSYAVTFLGPPNDSSTNSYTVVTGISNGVVVGNINTGYGNNYRAIRWNSDGTQTQLPSPKGSPYFQVSGISGETIVGTTIYSGDPTPHYQATRLNPDGSFTNLNTVGGNQTYTFGVENGVTVGYTTGYRYTNSVAVRWNADGSADYIGYRAAQDYNINLSYTFGRDISDGVIVGYGSSTAINNGSDRYVALRFNLDGTVTNLAKQAGIGYNGTSIATAISHGVTVGYGSNNRYGRSPVAYRWNADNTVTNLNSLLNMGTNVGAGANDIANGLVVGTASGSTALYGGNNSILWKADGTYVNLSSFTNNTVLYDSAANAIDETTGIIIGRTTVSAGASGKKDQSVMWTPLNSGSGGSNSLAVGAGVTTLINRDFTQIAGETKVNGTLAFDDANTANGNETFTLAGGTLSGAGTITGNLVNTGGIVAPGNSPGTMTVNGNYTQSGNGILKIEIASLSDFDVIHILGDATAGGTLDVSVLGAYAPLEGDSFDFLQVDGLLTGMFDTINITGGDFDARDLSATLSPSSGGKGFSLAITSAVVPESSTLALISLAVPVLGTIAIRRKK